MIRYVIVSFAVLALAFASCGDEDESPSSEAESVWLMDCETNADCGEEPWFCYGDKRCQRKCSNDQECKDAGFGESCIEVGPPQPPAQFCSE